jgi:hypothetical protein
MTTVCGQELLQPTSPAKAECYAAANAWLTEQCPLCGGNQACQDDLRGEYLALIFACDHPTMVAVAEHVRRVFADRRAARLHRH